MEKFTVTTTINYNNGGIKNEIFVTSMCNYITSKEDEMYMLVYVNVQSPEKEYFGL